MEQVSAVSRCFTGCIRIEKELPMLFIVPHSFHGKFKRSDSNSTSTPQGESSFVPYR